MSRLKDKTKKQVRIETAAVQDIIRQNCTACFTVLDANSNSLIIQLGDESRDFFYTRNEYTQNAIINLRTSSGGWISSEWKTTKGNIFMREIIRHLSGRNLTDIMNRLCLLSQFLGSSPKRSEWQFDSPEDFVLKTGRLMGKIDGISNTDRFRKLRKLDGILSPLPFLRSQALAEQFPSDCRYAEGFILYRGILQPHAWIVEPNGCGLDPYYDLDIPKLPQYFGTVFDIGRTQEILQARTQKHPTAPPVRLASLINGCYLDNDRLLKEGIEFAQPRDYTSLDCGF